MYFYTYFSLMDLLHLAKVYNEPLMIKVSSICYQCDKFIYVEYLFIPAIVQSLSHALEKQQ